MTKQKLVCGFLEMHVRNSACRSPTHEEAERRTKKNLSGIASTCGSQGTLAVEF